MQTNTSERVPFYHIQIRRVAVDLQRRKRPAAKEPKGQKTQAESGPQRIDAAGEQTTANTQAPARAEKRAYNREYMREWRKRNQERYREYNREYQRKRHMERKVQRILNAPVEKRRLCGYGCGRVAVETVERVDLRTWKSVRVPYCGHC